METSEVDTSILSSLHDNRYDYLQEDDKENFSDSAFLSENLDKDLPKTLPELSEITDSDTFLGDNEPSQMMTIDSSWYVIQNLFDSIFCQLYHLMLFRDSSLLYQLNNNNCCCLINVYLNSY